MSGTTQKNCCSAHTGAMPKARSVRTYTTQQSAELQHHLQDLLLVTIMLDPTSVILDLRRNCREKKGHQLALHAQRTASSEP